jgi:glutaryl-CoA dehydrogenase
MHTQLADTADAVGRKHHQDLFESPDLYAIDDLLTEEHKLIRSAVRSFVKKEISPIIEDYAQRAAFPHHLVKKFGEVGAFGPTIPEEYGGGGLDYIAYGLIMQEIERGDSGMRSTASVQGSLVMYPIYKYGSEEQRRKYLPKLASGEMLGCFGLTEPDHGSNPIGHANQLPRHGRPLPAQRRQDVDFQLAVRRRGGGVGQK